MSTYNKNTFIKTLSTQVRYSEQEEEELLKCADPVSGPVYFMKNFVYIQHPTKGRLLLEPYQYQLDLVHTYHNYRFSINLLGRQLGKCLNKDTNITVKNNNTGKIYDIPIGTFHEYQKAKKEGKDFDISIYQRKEI